MVKRVLPGKGIGSFSIWQQEIIATLVLSAPIVLTNLAQSALTTADVMLTGRLGAEALAAGALATNLYFACFIFGVGVITATSPMIANTLGRKRHAVRDVRRTFRQGLWAAIGLTIPVTGLLWQGETILLMLGQAPPLAAEAGHYLRILQWAYLPSLIYVLARSFVATLERPAWALLICVLALPLNVFVAWCLMFGNLGFPTLGLRGAGYATLLASLFMAVGMLVVVARHRKFRRYSLLGRFWRSDWPRFFAIWRLGLPIGLTLIFEVSVFMISAFLMGRLGTNELAAHVIALQVSYLCFMVPMGIGQAATIRVGLANGARNYDGVTRAGRVAMIIALAFAVLTALLIITVPHTLISLFINITDPLNAQVVAYASIFLFWAAVFQFSDGAQAVGSGMLRGLRDTRKPMIIAGIGYCVIGLPFGVVLAFFTPLRGSGIWIGLAVGLTVVALAMGWRWRQRQSLHV